MSVELLPPVVPAAARSGRIQAVVLLCFCLTFVLLSAAVIGGWLAPQDPSRQSLVNASSPPNGEFWLGTDGLGRDILSRVLVGARPALQGPAVVALGATTLALALGLLAGFRGGWIETVIMRGTDMLFAIPSLLVVIVAVGLFGGGYWLAVLMLILLSAPGGVRMIRSATLAQRNLPYIEAARTLGVPGRKLMFVHILPNIMPNVVATVLLDFVGGLVALSALSFLGLGSPPGASDWGLMLAENRSLLQQNPWAAITPAVLLIIAAFSVTVLGDWLHERLMERKDARG
ncbi:ABC transporter permease [Aeromicrobium sp. P5_D10]